MNRPMAAIMHDIDIVSARPYHDLLMQRNVSEIFLDVSGTLGAHTDRQDAPGVSGRLVLTCW